MKGTIIEYVLGREFGYLKNEKKDEYCFYSDDIQFENSLVRKGDKVYFDLCRGHGTRAINIRKDVK